MMTCSRRACRGSYERSRGPQCCPRILVDDDHEHGCPGRGDGKGVHGSQLCHGHEPATRDAKQQSPEHKQKPDRGAHRVGAFPDM